MFPNIFKFQHGFECALDELVTSWCHVTGLLVTSWCHVTGLLVTSWCHVTGLLVTSWCSTCGLVTLCWCSTCGLVTLCWCSTCGLATLCWCSTCGLATLCWCSTCGLVTLCWCSVSHLFLIIYLSARELLLFYMSQNSKWIESTVLYGTLRSLLWSTANDSCRIRNFVHIAEGDDNWRNKYWWRTYVPLGDSWPLKNVLFRFFQHLNWSHNTFIVRDQFMWKKHTKRHFLLLCLLYF